MVGTVVNCLHELVGKDGWNKAHITFTEDSFPKPYSEKERTYAVSRSEKFFDPTKLGTSLRGHCLDGIDVGVRLDMYREWEIEKIVIVE